MIYVSNCVVGRQWDQARVNWEVCCTMGIQHKILGVTVYLIIFSV